MRIASASAGGTKTVRDNMRAYKLFCTKIICKQLVSLSLSVSLYIFHFLRLHSPMTSKMQNEYKNITGHILRRLAGEPI